MNAKVNSQSAAPAPLPGSQLISMMAASASLDANAFAQTVKTTCFDKDCTREQFIAFLMIAKEHDLNPITREIYAFEKGGKITSIVSIDGWLKIINSHPQFNGMEFVDTLDDAGKLVSITCKMWRRDRDHPTMVTEYYDECFRPTEPWKKWPIRMLRHKATIQCARYAFGFAGIVDPEEAERIRDSKVITGVAHSVEDAPETTAKRIASKIKAKVEKEDLAPPEVSHEVVADDPMDPDAIAAELRADPETGEIHLDDIPGLKKGSDVKMSPEAQAFIDDMEKPE